MKYYIAFVSFIAAYAFGCLVSSRCDTNSPAVHAKEIQAQINQQAFAEGVRFGLIAKQRNQDIMDIRALTQIAYSLFSQQQQAMEQQRVAKVPASTNAAPTNAVQNAEEE